MILAPPRPPSNEHAGGARDGHPGVCRRRRCMDLAAEQRTTNGTDVNEPAAAPPAARVLAWVDRNRRWMFAGIAVLYLAAFTGRWRINPDSAIYMSLGRNLAETGHYVYN